MPQLDHLTIGDAPVNIAANLAAGRYIAQVRGGVLDSVGVLYATAASAPDDAGDYFHCLQGRYFTFVAGGAPTWVQSAYAGVEMTVAVAQYA